MPNRYNGDYSGMQKRSGGNHDARKPLTQAVNEKPAFPKADLPGKSQPSDRSGGVRRVRVDPQRKGL